MHMQSMILWIALAITIAIPFYMWRRRRDVLGGFNAMLQTRGFSKRDVSPVAALTTANPPDGFHFSSAYSGAVSDVPLTLLLLKRTEGIVVQGMPMQNQTFYVGVHLPAAVAANDGFVADWQRKAQGGRDHVVHASRPAEGGALIVWKGPPARANVEAHLAALAGTLRHAGQPLRVVAHDS